MVGFFVFGFLRGMNFICGKNTENMAISKTQKSCSIIWRHHFFESFWKNETAIIAFSPSF